MNRSLAIVFAPILLAAAAGPLEAQDAPVSSAAEAQSHVVPGSAGNTGEPAKSLESNDAPAAAPNESPKEGAAADAQKSQGATGDQAAASGAGAESGADQAAAAAGAPPAPPLLGSDVRTRLQSLKGATPEETSDIQALVAFYEARRDEALWVARSGWNERAKSVIGELGKANEWGLETRDFEVPPLPASGEPPLMDLVNAELRLSLTVLQYARFARGGRIADPAKQLSSYLDRLPQYRNPKSVLEELAAASDPAASLRGLNPKHPQFEKLRQAYLAMIKGAAGEKTIVIIPPGPKLLPGSRHEQIALLRKRLDVAQPADGDATLYDPLLVEAVKKFQQEKGTRADAVVGSATRALLNDVELPNPSKLLANMEEWRWMPEDLGSFYVQVNIPEFMFRVVKDGKVVHEERVVTGEVAKQTPVFSDEMETVYLHPRWIVPESIKVLELYPSMARGGGAISRQGLKLLYNGREVSPSSVDWGSADIRHYDIYQPPGPGNVLGVVKFAFPNKHGVYMHDTSSKGLFEEASRPFSHGCMRVRNPLKLAELVLDGEPGWDPERIRSVVESDADELPIQLQRKVPVHITYFTAAIDDAGNQEVWRDVYGHEQRITLALAGKWSQIVRGPDHLAPVKFVRLPSSGFEFADPFSFFFGSYGSDNPPPQTKPKGKQKSGSGSLADLFSGF